MLDTSLANSRAQSRPLDQAATKPMNATPQLLLIDDDSRLTTMLGDYLKRAGFEVTVAGSLAAGREQLNHERFDLLVLDIMLPDGDGLEFCRELRGGANKRLPVLMLSARGEPMDRILGLELGADDYLAKPFEPRELQARVKALLRRAEPQAEESDEVLRFGRLEIDLAARMARLDGKPCELTSHQFDLLVVLAQSPGRVLSRDQIMDALKGHPLDAFDRSIDVHVSRIRAVIEEDVKNPRRVLTVRGVGYVFAKKQDAE
jgi:DNA-binding response OmpR family regulator